MSKTMVDNLAEKIADKITKNMENNVVACDGKLIVNLSISDEYLKGIEDTIQAMQDSGFDIE